MSAEPVFTFSGESGLWLLAGSDGSVGFHLPAPAPDVPPLLPLSASWSQATGTYVFLPGPAPAGFDARLGDFLRRFDPAPPRFLWIANPDQAIATWRTVEIDLAGEAAQPVVVRRTDFELEGYTLTVRGGGTVGVRDTGPAGWGFTFGDTTSAAAAFLTPAGSIQARTGSTMLGMAGDGIGRWRFALDVAAGTDAFALLDCGIRYFVPNPALGSVTPIPFHTVQQPAALPLALFASIDVLRPTAPDRSHIGLFGWDGSGTPPEFESGFVTARGYRVALTPLASGAVPARLAFHVQPRDMGPPGATVRRRLYLAPEGAFGIHVLEPTTTDPLARLVCGISGLEYFGVVPNGARLHFVANRPAYAVPDADDDAALPLGDLGTTAWLYCAEAYYAQPEDAPLFAASDAVSAAAGYLDFLEIAATTPPPADGVRAFPMAPFLHLDPALTGAAVTIERRAIAPARRAALLGISNAVITTDERAAQWAASLAAADGDAETIGVTAQGLAVGVAAGGQWNWLGIAQSNAAAAPRPDLRFTQAIGDFRQALQTNNLFMVLGHPELFALAGSIGYQITAHDVSILRASPSTSGWPPGDLAAVINYVERNSYPYFATRTDFVTRLRAARPALTDAQLTLLARQAGLLSAVVHDWAFKLGPDTWQTPDRSGQTNSYVIFKFALGRSLADLAGDTGSWTWREVASAKGATRASRDIGDVIAAAAGDGVSAPDAAYANFLDIVHDKDWTGILALSVEVPLDALPGPLQSLAAGIDPKAFYAHHIGFSVTPFELAAGPPPRLTFLQTAMFGLIDYENPVDQYFSSDIAFAFRVLQLKILFVNSVIRTFASRVELMVNRLFGADTRLLPADHGNNMILTGAYQQQTAPDGSTHDSYVFASGDDYQFLLPGGGALSSVEILSIQLLTSKAAAPGTLDVGVEAVFQMTGALRFYDAGPFDPFCWGPHSDASTDPPIETDGRLRFGNLAVGMAFSLADPAGTTKFTLRDGDLSFDIANSVARTDSLASRFPVRLKRLITTPDPALPGETPTLPGGDPDSLGFVTISAPLQQSKLTTPWYGLHYAIDLGSLGALAGSAALTLELMAAWSPAASGAEPIVYLGVKLPGADGTTSTSLPLQGFLKLGFKSMEFLVDQPATGPHRYTLQLRDFAIRLLGLSFPPGRNEIYLFGNPDQSADAAVGWYAAYSSDGDPKKLSTAPGRPAVRAARAALRLPGSTVAGGDHRG